MTARPFVAVALLCVVVGGAFAACSATEGASTSPGDAGNDGTTIAEASVTSDGGVADAGIADVVAPGEGGSSDLGIFADFCPRFAKADCDRTARCNWTTAPDPGCEIREAEYCRLYARAELQPAMAKGLVTYDPNAAAACFASPMDLYCSTNNLWQIGACDVIFNGTVPNGGDCLSLYFATAPVTVCANGGCVNQPSPPANTCYTGTCTAFVAPGEFCQTDAGAYIEPGCGPHGRCSQITKRCAPELAAGASCTEITERCNNVEPALWCLPVADGGAGGECASRRPGGLSCYAPSFGYKLPSICASGYCPSNTCADTTDAGDAVCTFSVCPKGMTCRYMSGDPPVCKPVLGEGAACPKEGCAPGLSCFSMDGGASLCVAPPATGQPCSGACGPGLICQTHGDAGALCAPPVTLGGTCGDDATCAQGLNCIAATRKCAPPVDFGGACTDDGDCDRGLYCVSESHTCGRWKPHGAACTRGAECVYAAGCTDAGVCESLCNAQ